MPIPRGAARRPEAGVHAPFGPFLGRSACWAFPEGSGRRYKGFSRRRGGAGQTGRESGGKCGGDLGRGRLARRRETRIAKEGRGDAPSKYVCLCTRGRPEGRDPVTARARDARFGDWLMPFLLLCMRGGDLNGYELLRKVEELGFGAVRPGEVYRTLRRAEQEGLVLSEKGNLMYLLSHRRYRLAEAGEAYIEFLADSLASYKREIEAFLRAYEERPVVGAYG